MLVVMVMLALRTRCKIKMLDKTVILPLKQELCSSFCCESHAPLLRVGTLECSIAQSVLSSLVAKIPKSFMVPEAAEALEIFGVERME